MPRLSDIKILPKIAISFAAVILISTAAGVSSYNGLSRQEAASEMTEHTYSVITSLNSVAASMVDQETGVRGFLLSGDEAFLEPQKKGATRFRESLDRVRSLTVDNPVQQRRLDEVEGLARQWNQKVIESELPLMRNPATREQARSIENSGWGKLLWTASAPKWLKWSPMSGRFSRIDVQRPTKPQIQPA